MSRIGRKPIALPSGASVQVADTAAVVKGPKGELRVSVPAGIEIDRKDGHVVVRRGDDSSGATHGLVRSLLANAVRGVTQGFERHLDIVGIGYRAEAKGDSLQLALGYSHPIVFSLPKGVSAAVEKQTHIILKGADKQQLGQAAAELRALRPPDPYKNKGIRYTGERLKKKVGKAAAGAGAAKA